jgi:hypothetical protein
MKPSNNKVPGVKTTKAGDRTLIVRRSLFDALELEDPIPEAQRPVTITHRQAQELTNLSKSTIDRMIRVGREAAAA